ncbi:MAG TPA: biopolymer transporter ExbD [Spirochaetota bacterium]|nr:biopolymer transporter ExbD [Spirochaetota bacterium]HQP47659.1 biopolymer transporter ExbD [Spirochaetota bacterium]
MPKIRRSIRMLSEMNLSSMSDISFILIIFFMVTSVFTMKEGLHLTMPDNKKQPMVVAAQNVVTIQIDERENITYRDQAVDPVAIEDMLIRDKKNNPKMLVLLKVSSKVPYEKAVGIIDRIQFSGIKKLTLRMI